MLKRETLIRETTRTDISLALSRIGTVSKILYLYFKSDKSIKKRSVKVFRRVFGLFEMHCKNIGN